MKTYTIDAENNITAHDTAQEAEALASAERFATEAELNQLAAKWPDTRPTEIYNTLPGATAGTTFKTRKAAVAQIWKAIKGLGEPRPATSRNVAPRKPRVAPAKAKPSKKTTPPKKGAKAAKRATKPARAKEASTPRAETKGAKIVALIGRPKGATLAEIMKAVAWQAHSVRGYLSTAAKKHGIKIDSSKNAAGDRVYRIAK